MRYNWIFSFESMLIFLIPSLNDNLNVRLQILLIFHFNNNMHMYIYIYIYGIISSLIHISLNIIDIFCLHIFFVNPFKLPYWTYDIRRDLVDKHSIISYFPSTFCPTWSNNQERMYYKSDVTFVCTLLLCKNERLYCCIV